MSAMSMDPARLPRNVGEYRLLEVLGDGGLARTYLAETLTTGEQLALKELQLIKAREAKQIELFERECAALKELRHNQIPTFIATIVERRAETISLFLVQEFVDGRSLQQLVDSGRRFTPRETVAIIKSCLDPLEYLHARTPPLLHRDLKPSNIILRPDGHCVLIDFGAVRETIAEPRSGRSSVVGTFGYMAPEQFQARAYPATDLYALGATAVHLLTGKEPAELEIRRLKPDIHQHLDSDPLLAAILDLLLEPAIEDRYASTMSLRKALRRWEKKHGGVRRPETVLAGLAESVAPVDGAQATDETPTELSGTDEQTDGDVGALSADDLAADDAAGRGQAGAEQDSAETQSAEAPSSTEVPPSTDAGARAAEETEGATPGDTTAGDEQTAQKLMPQRVDVMTERSSLPDALIPGGHGARTLGPYVAIPGAAVLLFGLVLDSGPGTIAMAVAGGIIAAYGLLLAAIPRRAAGESEPGIARSGLPTEATIDRIIKQIPAIGRVEWIVEYRYTAVDGIQYSNRFRLPSSRDARRVAESPDGVLVRYQEFSPQLSVLVPRR